MTKKLLMKENFFGSLTSATDSVSDKIIIAATPTAEKTTVFLSASLKYLFAITS